jgi:carbamoyltransferase
MNIIGISGGYHDSACCLLQDGVLVAAAQEERFSRVKNDKTIPRRAFRFCLEQGAVTLDQVDCVAFYEDPCLKLGRQLWMNMVEGVTPERHRSIMARLTARTPIESIRQVLGFDGPIEIVDHHLSHAASAYLFSGFDEAAVLTVDGVGDWPTTTYSAARGAAIERIEAVDFPHSLGLFYSAVTGYLGFEVNEGEYKIMGLAPYGSPRYVDTLSKLIERLPGGQYALDMQYFGFLREDCMYSEEWTDLLGRPPRQEGEEVEQFHMDVARSAQVVLEEVLLSKVRYLHSRVPSDHLCMAGGVALNIVANGRCLREGPFKKLFVQPAAGDAGGALGAAAMAYVRFTGQRPRGPMTHAYLGPANSSDSVHRLLKSTPAMFEDFRGRERQLLEWVAERLIAGKVIAWCQGRCEFGPRALGARSILADPRRPEMRDRINASVKMREWFRPFAPAVLAAEQSKHFDIDHSSPFMLEACAVRSPLDLPAITHVDGTARPQTVHPESNPRFERLLQEFFRRTGCPILLNTSFNLRGEPIVLTAFDAIVCFVRSSLDVLVVEDFVIERESIPEFWQLMALQAGNAAQPPPRSRVYTFV